MSYHLSEIVKEYELRLSELDFVVKGKILKSFDEDEPTYFWTVSHFYAPAPEAFSSYIPGNRTSDDISRCDILLKRYLENFKNDRIETNLHY